MIQTSRPSGGFAVEVGCDHARPVHYSLSFTNAHCPPCVFTDNGDSVHWSVVFRRHYRHRSDRWLPLGGRNSLGTCARRCGLRRCFLCRHHRNCTTTSHHCLSVLSSNLIFSPVLFPVFAARCLAGRTLAAIRKQREIGPGQKMTLRNHLSTYCRTGFAYDFGATPRER